MEKSKFELDEEKTKHSTLNPTKREKKTRRVAVRDASFFLYKMAEEDGDLSQIGSYQTEIEICNAHSDALDEGIPEGRLVGFKGRPLEFTVIERRVAVR